MTPPAMPPVPPTPFPPSGDAASSRVPDGRPSAGPGGAGGPPAAPLPSPGASAPPIHHSSFIIHHSAPPLSLSELAIDPAQSLRLTPALARRRLLLPLSQFDGSLHIAYPAPTPPDPRTAALLLQAAHADHITFHPADPADLRTHILRLYGPETAPTTAPAPSQSSQSSHPSHPSQSPIQHSAFSIQHSPDDDPVALVDHLFRAARLRHASDIHIDPGQSAVTVRFRVDGTLETYRTLPLAALPSLVSRIKVLASLDIAERRAPQDGAFILPALPHDPRSATDVRVATLPVRHGERITLRLLSSDRENLTLPTLGMSPAHLALLERLLESPHGLILLTGPTGSGKSTTLYAIIRHLLRRHPYNILTVEDPIEYEIPGVAQAEVDSSDKVSFTKALRSLLRHDPDIIMIGEIRDRESLDIAVKAALTGHLVLSTLHTNDAPGAVARLLNMGLEPHLLAATLRLSIAQRLVQRLCPACHAPYALSDADASLLGQPALAGQTAYRPAGCLRCAGRGTLGRTALFEFFAPTPADAALIARNAPPTDLAAQLASEGHAPLAADAIAKIRAGIIPPSAALRAL